MFDSYYASEEIKCPECGTIITKDTDFQSKELACLLSGYNLGSKIDSSRRYVDWYHYCDGRYDKSWKNEKAICFHTTFNCRTTIDNTGLIVKEEITAYNDEKEEEIVVLTKELPKNSRECS